MSEELPERAFGMDDRSSAGKRSQDAVLLCFVVISGGPGIKLEKAQMHNYKLRKDQGVGVGGRERVKGDIM